MCGISGLFGRDLEPLEDMIAVQHHRGPDATGRYVDKSRVAALGHNRLSIIDLSDAGKQPMSSDDGRYTIAFNGEIYNYIELRKQLVKYPFRSRTDTEVILAAYVKWGMECFDKFIGMFALMIWDSHEQSLLAIRDRFGVKPLYYHVDHDGGLAIASEIKAIHAAGVDPQPDSQTWATFLTHGLYEHSERTFWNEIRSLPPGHYLRWSSQKTSMCCWYDLKTRVGPDFDRRDEATVSEEYTELLKESVSLRFRSDVPVGVNLSGGLDSSLLLGLVHQIQGNDSQVRVFTFTTGDVQYDELPWVERMLQRTHHPLTVAQLSAENVPGLAESITLAQDEPFGGLPTLAYANLFATARREGVIVLLDGQGLDEAWAGYDYYAAAMSDNLSLKIPTIQGTRDSTVSVDCLCPDFRQMARELETDQPFCDKLRSVQYRDARHTKLPRALRFNDRISMASSTELREPMLDHRLFELALSQPPERKRDAVTGKLLLRNIAGRMLGDTLASAPKRPVQTPQREWLRGPLRGWASQWIEVALQCYEDQWLDRRSVEVQWERFQKGSADNSFYVWQWISLGMCSQLIRRRTANFSANGLDNDRAK